MAEQLMDTALRALIAQWVKAALGELVEDGSLENEGKEEIVAALQSFCSKREEATPSCQSAPRLREKEES